MCLHSHMSGFSESLMTPDSGGDAKFPLTTWPIAFFSHTHTVNSILINELIVNIFIELKHAVQNKTNNSKVLLFHHLQQFSSMSLQRYSDTSYTISSLS